MEKFKDKLFIVIPCYNEEENIKNVIEDYNKIILNFENGKVLILNDGSKDKSAEIIKLNIQNKTQFIFIDKQNSGHGSTCLFGYKLAIEQNADYIFQVDSDNQNNSQDFWKLWLQKDKADFVFGNRKPRKDGFFRKIITTILKMCILIIFKVNVKDPNVPFRLMNAKILKKYIEIFPELSFSINSLISIMLLKNKEKIDWVDVEFLKREKGQGSISIIPILKNSKKVITELIWLKKNIKI